MQVTRLPVRLSPGRLQRQQRFCRCGEYGEYIATFFSEILKIRDGPFASVHSAVAADLYV